VICLGLIGLVVFAGPQWVAGAVRTGVVDRVPLGLAIYIAIRRRICD